MNDKNHRSTMNHFLITFLLGIVLFGINLGVVEASEQKKGNDFIKETNIKSFGEESITELSQGMMARLYYTLKVPDNYDISKGDTLEIGIPKQLQVLYHEKVAVYAGDKKVGEINEINMGSTHVTITFSEDIVSQTELTIENIIFNINDAVSVGEQTLDFGNDVESKLQVTEATSGIGGLTEQEPSALKNRSVITPSSWEADAGSLGNFFYGKNNIPVIKEKNPNFKGNIIESAIPYYFHGKDDNEKYLKDFIARCIDMNHSISLVEDAKYSNLDYYIEDENAKDITLNTQISFMLAQEHGLVLDTNNGSKKLLEFTEPNDYEQRAYLFASQMMGWIDALRYNKFDSVRIDNFDYTDMIVYSRKKTSDSYEKTNITPYIEEIEENRNLYKQADYMTKNIFDIKMGETKTIVEVPEKQKKFKHWIDKEKSENLDLLDGISESDFENFETLTVTPNKDFDKEKVKIVLRKGFYDSTEYQASAISENNNQYKQVIGMSDEYEVEGIVSLEMMPEIEENVEKIEVSVTKVWDDHENQDGLRPVSIDVQLYANGETVGDSVTLSTDNDWYYVWNELDKTLDGKIIDYTIKEITEVPGYSVSINDDPINKTITNTYTPELIDISGAKTWEDNENQAGIRPEVISVNLLANGVVYETKSVSAADNWSYSFTGLPKYKDGVEIIYTITENHVAGYSTEIVGTDLINRHTPEKTTATVIKEWRDNNDEAGKRPDSIRVQLYGNDQAIGSVIELSQENNWTYTWSDLEVQADGQNIVYTVQEEDKINDYYVMVDNDNQGNLIISNIYVDVKPSTGSKDKTGSNDTVLPNTGEKINYNYLLFGLSFLLGLGCIVYLKKDCLTNK